MKKTVKVIVFLFTLILIIATLTACNLLGDNNEVVITFDSNGGSSVPDVTVGEDGKFTLPINPTKEKYTFAGWYIDEELITAFNVTGEIPSSITVYAKWTENSKYAITFVAGEGATGTAPTEIDQYEGTIITLPENPYTKANYTFAGWTDGTTVYQPRASYKVGAQAVTFTATWTENAKYAITFTPGDGATGTAPTEEDQYGGAIIILPANTFIKTNYQFTGWSDGINTHLPNANYTVDVQDVIFTAVWEYFDPNINYTLSDDSTSYFVSSYEPEINGNTSILSMYNSLPVTNIGDNAFRGCTQLTSMRIPASVTSIDSYAFKGCTALTTVTFEDNSALESIGDYAFNGCSGLTSITIPASVTSIGYSTFDSCTSLANITFDEGSTLDSIGFATFFGCSELISITIPASVTSIGNWAFVDCSGLTSIIVESGNSIYHSNGNCLIDTVKKTLIAGCNNSIIPTDGSVTSIGPYSFSDCSGLTSITIPNSVTSIGFYAFNGCSGLTSITIPNSVTSIGCFAFNGCSGLTSITIPNSVTSIDFYAFYGCSELTSITFGDTSTWYRTTNTTDWANKTGGTQTSVDAPATNATNFTSRYISFYWYKK